MSPLTRRRLLASAGLGAAGVGLGAGGYLIGQDAAETRPAKVSLLNRSAFVRVT
jgi:hypothetical protein